VPLKISMASDTLKLCFVVCTVHYVDLCQLHCHGKHKTPVSSSLLASLRYLFFNEYIMASSRIDVPSINFGIHRTVVPLYLYPYALTVYQGNLGVKILAK
jgi:hypothetical protein